MALLQIFVSRPANIRVALQSRYSQQGLASSGANRRQVILTDKGQINPPA